MKTFFNNVVTCKFNAFVNYLDNFEYNVIKRLFCSKTITITVNAVVTRKIHISLLLYCKYLYAFTCPDAVLFEDLIITRESSVF